MRGAKQYLLTYVIFATIENDLVASHPLTYCVQGVDEFYP